MTSIPAKSAGSSKSRSPGLVGICAWLIPGMGYWILGQKARGVTVGISIVGLFIMGVLVGGIRISDPPGWGQFGYHVQLVERESDSTDRNGKTTHQSEIVRVDPSSPRQELDPASHARDRSIGWALKNQATAEITDKPWFVGQILCGPISLAASALAIHEAHPIDPEATKPEERVVASIAHSWEIGTLYTAVAGMLNLLVIIDSVFRDSAGGAMIPAFLGDTAVVYRIFLDPLPIWNPAWLWPLLMLPLCLALAVVYKSIRCRTMKRVPREAGELFVLIVVGMVLAAAALAGLAKWMQ